MTIQEEKDLDKLAAKYCASKGLHPQYDSKYSTIFYSFKDGWIACLTQK